MESLGFQNPCAGDSAVFDFLCCEMSYGGHSGLFSLGLCSSGMFDFGEYAPVAELADAQDLGSCGLSVGVRVPPGAPAFARFAGNEKKRQCVITAAVKGNGGWNAF